ncbi:MAG: PAS domain S-box protein [Spirochaetes bacterium]|nr:PAS domain S-box protein [Spirochaetota bacterium]
MSGDPKTILLVEDEAIIAMAEAKMLERNGYRTVLAHSGEEGVRIFRENGAIDLVLMDIDLGPGIDGTQAAAMILEKNDVPVVFLSSHTEPEVVDRTERITSYGYVVKNSGETVLNASIRMAFKLYSAHRELRKREERLIEILKEKDKAEDSLRKSEKKFEAIFQCTPNAVIIVENETGFIIDANRAVEWTGWTREELIGGRAPMFQNWVKSDDEKVLAAKVVNEGKVVNYPFDLYKKDGTVAHCLLNAFFVPVEDKKYLLAITSDITPIIESREEMSRAKNELEKAHGELQAANEELQSTNEELQATLEEFEASNEELIRSQDDLMRHEADLRRSERKYRALIDITNTGMVILDGEGRVLEANDEYKRLTGRENLDCIIGKHVSEWTAPHDLERTREEWQRLIDQGILRNLVMDYEDGKGSIIPVEINAAVVRDGDSVRIFSLCRDITERRKREKELAETWAILRSAFDQTPIPMLLVGAKDFKIIISNPACRDCLRIDAETSYIGQSLLALKRTWQDLDADGKPMEPKDTPLVLALRGVVTRNREGRIRFDDGTERWLLINSAPVLSPDGAIIAGFLAFDDITEQRNTLESLRRSETMFRLLAEKMNDIVWTTDLDLRTTYISPSIEKILGFTPEERMAQNPGEQLIPASLAHAAGLLKKELEREKESGVDPDRNIFLEMEYYHKNGFTVWLESNLSWQRDAGGTIVGIHGVSRDISVRKKAETELQQKAELIEGIVSNMPGVVYQFYATDKGEMGLDYVAGSVMEVFGLDGNPTDFFERFTACVADSDREGFLESINRAVASVAPWNFTGSFEKPGGERIDFQGLSLPIRHGDRIVFSGVMLDVTERKKSEEALASALEAKESLLRELQHRVKNSLSIIASLVGFESDRIDNLAMKEILEHIRNRIISVSQVYDMLYETQEIKELRLDQYLRQLAEYLMKTFNAGRARPVELRMDHEDIRISTKRAIPAGLILNELLTNAMKHAFPGEQQGAIAMTLVRRGDNVILTVADDGAGLPAGFNLNESKGLGLVLVRTLATQLGATVEYAGGEGARFCISFPVEG